MTKTKKSLLMSALSLLLCFSMLIGSTYAWFTDSVASGSNVITAGNLDLVVEYTLDGENWKDLDGADDLFQKDLWEPGHTEVVALRIKNNGTLALKYVASMNIVNEKIGKNKDGGDIVLSDILTVGTLVQEANQIGDIAVALAFEKENMYKGTTAFKASSILRENQELHPGSAHYVIIKVDMSETIGNEANHDGVNVPSIEFGINVFATQYTYESDSFGHDYDLGAPWAGKIPEKLENTTLEIVPGGGTQTGTITVNSAEDLVYLNKLAKEWVSLYSNGQGTNVGNYRENAGGKGTDYYYHWEWTVKLAADLDMSNVPMDSVDISYWDNFEGNGHTISNVVMKYGQDGLFNNGAKAVNDLTVKNISVNAPAAETVGAVSGNGSMTNVHVMNATVTGGKYVGGICGKGASFVNCSIKDSTVTGNNKTVGGLVGYSIGDPGAATVTGNVVENVTVTGAYNVGGLLGQSQNETVKDNTVKNVTVKSTLELPADASSNEVRSAEVAARSAFGNTTIGTNAIENVTLINVAHVADTAELQAAINSGATEIALGAGEFTADLYVVPANRKLTITGQGAATKLNFSKQQVRLQLFDSLTISNCTIGRMLDKSWGQLVFGSSTVAGGVYTLSNCTFNGEGTQGIFINKNVAATFNIENCTFNGDFGGEGAITIQDNNVAGLTVNVTGCSFNNIPATSHEIAVLQTSTNPWTLNAEGVTVWYRGY